VSTHQQRAAKVRDEKLAAIEQQVRPRSVDKAAEEAGGVM